jgi:hypothetical protein
VSVAILLSNLTAIVKISTDIMRVGLYAQGCGMGRDVEEIILSPQILLPPHWRGKIYIALT